MVLLEGILEQFQGLLDHRGDLPRALLGRRAADKIPHFGHHLLQVAHLFGDDGQFPAGLVVKPRGLEKLPGKPPDDEQRVFDFVGDVGHGIAHRGQAFGLEHPVFHGLIFGDVPHDGGKIQVALDFGHGKGDAQGKFLSVPAPGGEAPLPAQDMGLPGGEIAPHIVPVDLCEGRRNDEFQVLAQGFVAGVAEHRLGAPVVADDDVVFVDGDEGVGGAHDDAGVDLLLLAQLLELADQGFQEAGGGAGERDCPPFPGEKSAIPAVRNWPSRMRSKASGCKSGKGCHRESRGPGSRVGGRTRPGPPAGSLPGRRAA